MIVRFGLPVVGIWPCPGREETIENTTVYVGQPTDQCYRMEPQRRWIGLWRDEFEGSRFCPAPETQCSNETSGDIIWLDVERVTRKQPDGALYAVELLGRRTAVRGHHGHLGGSDHELIVDRFISIKKVGPPLTKAQSEAELQRCLSGKRRCSSWDK